jgi:hypothetical protein
MGEPIGHTFVFLFTSTADSSGYIWLNAVDLIGFIESGRTVKLFDVIFFKKALSDQ